MQYGQWKLWEMLMVRTMFQIETLGFRAIVFIPGHYPLFRPLDRAIDRYVQEGGICKMLSLKDSMYAEDGNYGDHAAAFETSLMLALYPELVNMDELDKNPSMPNIGVIGADPRSHASKEFGQKILLKFEKITETFIEEALHGN